MRLTPDASRGKMCCISWTVAKQTVSRRVFRSLSHLPLPLCQSARLSDSIIWILFPSGPVAFPCAPFRSWRRTICKLFGS
jgi:hypothetical protein